MNKKIIIDIRFNMDLRTYGEGINKERLTLEENFQLAQTKEWIDYRMYLFMKYTAMSLKNQTNQNFIAMVRYNRASEKWVYQALRSYPKLPSNIFFTCVPDRVIKKELKSEDFFYHGCIDTDNMFKQDFIEQIHQFPYDPGLECIICKAGYVYDTTRDLLAEIYHPSSSCLVYLYSVKDYYEKYQERFFVNHYYAMKLNHQELKGRNYMVLIHKQNVYNDFEEMLRRYKGIIIEDKDIKGQILKEWNL